MKILLLNYTDDGGGAAIAAKRLLSSLLINKINVVLGVIEKNTNDNSIISLKKESLYDLFIIFRLLRKLKLTILSYLQKILKMNFLTTNYIFHSENKKTLMNIDHINNSDFDLVHLHWINYDMISIEDIAKIKKPIVWTMHDSWVFCGAEHHPNITENDTRYIEGYTLKNKPNTTIGTDICRKTWERKKKSWKDVKFNLISPSNFEKDSLNMSALFKHISSTCTVIPNIIPEMIFKPLNKKLIREIYQIPLNKNIIGFGAAHDLNKKKSIKGGYYLIEALKKIQNKSNYHLIMFGSENGKLFNEIGIPTFTTGFISNSYVLNGIYNLCDVFVCPSLIENLPNVCLESLFCGIPVTAFNTGGIPDIVEHKKTGYLANCFDTDDLLNGVLYCIDNYDELSSNSIIKAHLIFNNDTIVKKHIELYNNILRVN